MNKNRRQVVPGSIFVCVIIAAGALAISAPMILQSKQPDIPAIQIDINSASTGELTLLPGVGPKLAERIIEDRLMNGPFQSIDDLSRVQWVGPNIINRANGLLIVDESTVELSMNHQDP